MIFALASITRISSSTTFSRRADIPRRCTGTFAFDGASTRRQGAMRLQPIADSTAGRISCSVCHVPAGKVDQLRNRNSIYMQSYAVCARDHWRINRSITLSYGLRWERYPFPTKDNTGMNRFDPADGNIYTAGGLGNVPARQWRLRLGRAISCRALASHGALTIVTVIRGGFGQSLDPRPFIDFRNAYPIVNTWADAGDRFQWRDQWIHSSDDAAPGINQHWPGA